MASRVARYCAKRYLRWSACSASCGSPAAMPCDKMRNQGSLWHGAVLRKTVLQVSSVLRQLRVVRHMRATQSDATLPMQACP